MTLTALRTHEDGLRRRLEIVRDALATAVLKIEIAERAADDLAAARDRGGKQGAYRDVAAERVGQWETDVAEGEGAREQRKRLREEEATLLAELESARREIEHAGVKSSTVRALATIPDASACPVRWSEMSGDGDVRTCPRCRTRALVVAMLDPEGAEKLLAERGGGDLHRRSDGAILVGDCPVGVAQKRTWHAAPAAIGAGFFAAAVVAAIAFVFWTARATKAVNLAPPTYFGGTSAPPPIPTPQLHGLPVLDTQALRIDDDEYGGGTDRLAHVTLRRAGETWSYTTNCAQTPFRGGTVPDELVESFLRAVEAAPPSIAPMAFCGLQVEHFIDITVHFEGPAGGRSVRTLNCSRQWISGTQPLAAEPDASPNAPHPRINAAYAKLSEAVGVSACPFRPTPVEPAPSGRIRIVGRTLVHRVVGGQ